MERVHSGYQIDDTPVRDWIQSSQALVLEIGTGKGLFLQNTAGIHPTTYFVGVEIAKKYVQSVNEKLHGGGLLNAMVVEGDALPFVQTELPDSRLSQVHVYFPDPWWKKRHKRRRVLSDTMLAEIERILRPDGELHFWTDVLDYYEVAIQSILEQTKLEGPEYVEEPPCEHDLDYQTHFERRTRRNGLPVYRSLFRKTKS